MFSKKILKLLVFICILPFLLNSCANRGDARKSPPQPELRVKRNLEQGKGFRLMDSLNKGKSTNYEFASSNDLWRASLDAIDFMPLSSVNYSGGIIVTDWYFNNENSNESVKISIRFLTNEIRSDALKVIIHKKKCISFNNCKIITIENSTNDEIKFAILKKAAQIQKQDLAKTKEKNSDYKLPKNF